MGYLKLKYPLIADIRLFDLSLAVKKRIYLKRSIVDRGFIAFIKPIQGMLYKVYPLIAISIR